jgi:hypothetical protein
MTFNVNNVNDFSDFDEVIVDAKNMETLTIIPTLNTCEERGIKSDNISLRDKDSIVRMDKIEFVSYNKVIIPGYGDKGDLLNISNYAANKFGSMIGVNWFKFFNANSSPDIINRAIQDHLATKSPKFIKVVAMEHFKPKAKVSTSIVERRRDTSDTFGVVRGFVGVNYQQIPDKLILQQLRNQCKERGELNKFKVQEAIFADEISRFNIVSLDSAIEKDAHLFGLSLKNSGTGYCALTANIYCFRVVCRNGMLSVVADSGKLLWQKHIRVNEEKILQRITYIYNTLIETRDSITGTLKRLMSEALLKDDAEAEFKYALRGFPKKLIKTVIGNFEESTTLNRYNILQTITRTARDIANPIVKFGLETAAGKYLNIRPDDDDDIDTN